MTTSFVQISHVTSGDAAITVTNAGDLLIFGSVQNGNTAEITSIVDSTGDAWTVIQQAAPFGGSIELWYDSQSGGCASGTHTLSLTWSASVASSGFDFSIAEYQPTALGPVDQSTSGESGGATISLGPTGSVSQNNELGILFAGAAGGAAWPVSVPLINATTPNQRAMNTFSYGTQSYWGDVLALGTGTQTAGATANTAGAFGNWGLILATFETQPLPASASATGGTSAKSVHGVSAKPVLGTPPNLSITATRII